MVPSNVSVKGRKAAQNIQLHYKHIPSLQVWQHSSCVHLIQGTRASPLFAWVCRKPETVSTASIFNAWWQLQDFLGSTTSTEEETKAS